MTEFRPEVFLNDPIDESDETHQRPEAPVEPMDADLISDEEALTAAEAELNADPDPEAITIEGEPSAEPIAQTEPDSRYVTGDLDDDQSP